MVVSPICLMKNIKIILHFLGVSFSSSTRKALTVVRLREPCLLLAEHFFLWAELSWVVHLLGLRSQLVKLVFPTWFSMANTNTI